MVWLLCKQIADSILEKLQTDCLPFGLLYFHIDCYSLFTKTLKNGLRKIFWKEKKYLPERKIKRLQILCKYEVLLYSSKKKTAATLYTLVPKQQQLYYKCNCLFTFLSIKVNKQLHWPPKLLYWLHYILLLWNYFYSETEPIDFLYTTLALSSPFIENITYRTNFYNNYNIYRGLLEKKKTKLVTESKQKIHSVIFQYFFILKNKGCAFSKKARVNNHEKIFQRKTALLFSLFLMQCYQQA